MPLAVPRLRMGWRGTGERLPVAGLNQMSCLPPWWWRKQPWARSCRSRAFRFTGESSLRGETAEQFFAGGVEGFEGVAGVFEGFGDGVGFGEEFGIEGGTDDVAAFFGVFQEEDEFAIGDGVLFCFHGGIVPPRKGEVNTWRGWGVCL